MEVGETSGGGFLNCTTFFSGTTSGSGVVVSTTMLSFAKVVLRIFSRGRSTDFGGRGGGLLSVVGGGCADLFGIRSLTDRTSTDWHRLMIVSCLVRSLLRDARLSTPDVAAAEKSLTRLVNIT